MFALLNPLFISSMKAVANPWKHSSMLWLSTNIIGAFLLGMYLAITNDWFQLAPVIGFFAAGLSLPTIVLAVPIIENVFAYPTHSIRIVGAFFATTGLFGITLGEVIIINQEFQLPRQTITALALPFYLAALAATWLEYRPWLLNGGTW